MLGTSRKILTVLASSAVLAMVGTTSAWAATTSVSVYNASGVLKATGSYNSTSGALCARAHNSVSDASARTELMNNGNVLQGVSDSGGDTANTCRNVGDGAGGGTWGLKVCWISSGTASNCEFKYLPAP